MTPEETSHHIAAQLAETGAAQRRQIAHIVRHLGEGRALDLLAKTQEIEAAGGMLTLDGTKRSRTLGGIFFRLVYETAPDIVRQLRQWQTMRRKRQAEASAVLQKAAAVGGKTLPIASATGDSQSFNVNEIVVLPPVEQVEGEQEPILKTVSNKEKREIVEKGCTVKITLVGRPEKVIDKDSYVKLSMRAKDVPALPKGLPTPAPISTQYVVVISARQWHQVAGALKDESDSLIVEGWPQVNKEAGNVAVFATSCTTKKLQQAKRAAQLVGAGATG